MAPKLSEQDLAMLTEEERQGLLDDELVDEGLEGDEDDAGEDGDVSGGDDTKNEGKADEDASASETGDDGARADATPAVAAPDVNADADAGTGDDAGGDDTVAADEEQERQAAWILPADVDDKIKALDEERDRIVVSFDDGDLTAQEMRAKLKPLEQQLDELKEQRITANTLRGIAVQDYTTKTVPDFLKDHPEYKPGSLLYKMLDDEVRKLQQGSRDPLNPKHLRRAHETVAEQLRAALGTEGAKKDPPPKSEKTTPKREVVPTLAGVPAADITDSDDGGEFAYLDRLAAQDVVAYEKELAKLPDHKRDQYLAQ